MADHRRFLYLVLFSTFASTLHALQFVVGGRDGWVLNPYENYNHWAQRMRFQVNDTLLFNYQNVSDSVLAVNKDDYEKCSTGNPILKLEDGNSVATLDRSGIFFFISGTQSNCVNGQKLIVVVLAVRNRPTFFQPPPQPKAPPPAIEAPAPSITSPPAEAPSPASGAEPSPPGNGTSPPRGNATAIPHHRSFATAAASISSLVLASTISLACFVFIF